MPFQPPPVLPRPNFMKGRFYMPTLTSLEQLLIDSRVSDLSTGYKAIDMRVSHFCFLIMIMRKNKIESLLCFDKYLLCSMTFVVISKP